MDQPASPDPSAALRAERDRLRGEIRESAIQAPDPMTYGSQAAAASQVFEQQRDLALRDHYRQLVEAVDAALVRIEAGTYGTCTSCGGPVGAERLEALPAAALCIDCQRAVTGRRR
jgi:DnaK suppressor protein